MGDFSGGVDPTAVPQGSASANEAKKLIAQMKSGNFNAGERIGIQRFQDLLNDPTATPEEKQFAQTLINSKQGRSLGGEQDQMGDLAKMLTSVNQSLELQKPADPNRNPILTLMDNNPATANLPEDVKVQIASDPNHPLNPNNPNSVIETTSPEGALAAGEQIQQTELAKRQQDQINQFGQQYMSDAEAKRQELAQRLTGQETTLQDFYDQEAARREEEAMGLYGGLQTSMESDRARRSQELQDQLTQLQGGLAASREKTFQTMNPAILEDLNSRGLLTSETAVTQAQADAIARLQAQDEAKIAEQSIANQGNLTNLDAQTQSRLDQYRTAGLSELQGQRATDLASVQASRDAGNTALNQFDVGAFGEGQDIYGEGLNTLIGGEQSALENALNLRRGKLENTYNLAQSSADRQFASDLAKQQKKGSLGRIFASGGKQS